MSTHRSKQQLWLRTRTKTWRIDVPLGCEVQGPKRHPFIDGLIYFDVVQKFYPYARSMLATLSDTEYVSARVLDL